VPALNKDIKQWIETWNDDPKPYVWTKTADQIIESITRYCTTITELSTLVAAAGALSMAAATVLLAAPSSSEKLLVRRSQ
jgi:hypothetical protein